VSISIALIIFFGSLILGTMSSAVLAERLEQVGERFCFPAGLLGLVTALGANSPEITSAMTA
jgi:Ca2+/Na+ antiporter